MSGSSSARFISTPMRRIRSPAAPAPRAATRRRAAEQRDELAPFHRPSTPVLPNERNSTTGDCCTARFRASSMSVHSGAVSCSPGTVKTEMDIG